MTKTKIATDETLPDISAKEAEGAQKDGILSKIADDAGQRFAQTDGIAVTEDPAQGSVTPTYDVFHLQDMVDMDPDALKEAINGGRPVTEGQIAGLLEVERSGKNRDDIVNVLMDRLGIDTPYAVTDAGPAYTNVVNRKTVKAKA